MTNYKNLSFNNTREGFQSWSKAFPPLDIDSIAVSKIHKKGDYYLELQLVEGFINADPFVYSCVRKYDHEDKDFANLYSDSEQEKAEILFDKQITEFTNKYIKGE